MVRKVGVVSAALQKKGMEPREGDHHIMFSKKVGGVTTLITRISRSHNEISNRNAGKMANQCALQLREFWSLVDCTLSEEQWDQLIRQRCAGGRNPFIFR